MSYNIYEVDIKNAIAAMQDSIDKKESAAFFVESEDNFAYVPFSWNNQDLFSQYGITGYNMFYDTPDGGGVIIGSPGDLSFLVMRPYNPSTSICEDFEQHLIKYMKSKFPSAEFDSNDIMIDGKKSIGMASNIFDGMTLFMFMASFVDNSELIRILCPKGHTKVPQPINTNILTKQELKSEIMSWLQ